MIACLTSHAESVLSIMQSQLEVGGYFVAAWRCANPHQERGVECG